MEEPVLTAMGPDALSAAEVVRLLDLRPHPEGGHFRETFRDPRAERGRAASTAILLSPRRRRGLAMAPGRRGGDLAFLRRRPLVLTISPDGHDAAAHRLGPDLASGERPQIVVPAVPGRRQQASAPGRSSAARSRPASSSPVSRWRRPGGSRRRAKRGRRHGQFQSRPAAREPAGRTPGRRSTTRSMTAGCCASPRAIRSAPIGDAVAARASTLDDDLDRSHDRAISSRRISARPSASTAPGDDVDERLKRAASSEIEPTHVLVARRSPRDCDRDPDVVLEPEVTARWVRGPPTPMAATRPTMRILIEIVSRIRQKAAFATSSRR